MVSNNNSDADISSVEKLNFYCNQKKRTSLSSSSINQTI